MLFERLIKDLRSSKDDLERLISQGQVEDFPKYKYLAGKVKGLEAAIEICKDTFKRYDDDENRN